MRGQHARAATTTPKSLRSLRISLAVYHSAITVSKPCVCAKNIEDRSDIDQSLIADLTSIKKTYGTSLYATPATRISIIVTQLLVAKR